MSLNGRSIAILIAPRGTEEAEFAAPRAAVLETGAKLTVVGLERGQASTNNGDLDPGSSYAVDLAITDASADQFDALIIPGGCVGADKLRASPEIVSFVRGFFAASKPVAVICHGPWVLVEAGVVKGRTMTSFPSIRTDIENAGGTWVDEKVVVDKGLVTSRNPHDLPAFCEKLIEEVARSARAARPGGGAALVA